MNVVNSLVDFATSFISSGGILFGFFLIFLESLVPALPLGVFVALNVNAFGFLIGVAISWIATCLGCFLSYSLFYYLSNRWIYKLLATKLKGKVNDVINKFKKITLPNLVLLIALPFTPAFLINIICGISEISREKFIAAILIGKIFMLLFWAYVGKSLIESITDINTIILISIMLVVAYFISKLVSRKMNIE